MLDGFGPDVELTPNHHTSVGVRRDSHGPRCVVLVPREISRYGNGKVPQSTKRGLAMTYSYAFLHTAVSQLSMHSAQTMLFLRASRLDFGPSTRAQVLV